jgi:hypothetical protein
MSVASVVAVWGQGHLAAFVWGTHAVMIAVSHTEADLRLGAGLPWNYGTAVAAAAVTVAVTCTPAWSMSWTAVRVLGVVNLGGTAMPESESESAAAVVVAPADTLPLAAC